MTLRIYLIRNVLLFFAIVSSQVARSDFFHITRVIYTVIIMSPKQAVCIDCTF